MDDKVSTAFVNWKSFQPVEEVKPMREIIMNHQRGETSYDKVNKYIASFENARKKKSRYLT